MQIWWVHFSRIVAFFVIGVGCGCDSATLLTFETRGADQLRPVAIVIFDTNLEPGNYTARDHTGKHASMQVDQSGTATMLMSRAHPDVVMRWTVSHDPDLSSDVKADETDNQIVFRVQGRSLASYHISAGQMPRIGIREIYRRDGYLHPLWTPNGRIVTDDYPPDHLHHHGIWAAWTRTRFQGQSPDFWNMGAGSGRVEVERIDTVWSGSVHAGLHAMHRYVSLVGEEVTVLHESWQMNVYRTSVAANILDLKLTQTTATDSALLLMEHHYGGVGVRGHRDWAEKDAVEFFTSEGLTRENGNATRARWAHIGGVIEGQYAGISVLSHPMNHEAPQPIRIHPTQPFLNFAPTQSGAFQIRSDEPAIWRYRLIIHDGRFDPKLVEALWNDYANPLTVRIIRASSS